MHDDDMISVGRPIPRLARARALDGSTLEVTWRGNAMPVRVDLSPALVARRHFQRLRTDSTLFSTARVNDDGTAVIWDDGSEVSALWIEDLAAASLDNAQFRDAMDRLHFTLDAMAAHLGIARRLVADYRKDKPIPKTVALATRYLLTQKEAS